MMPFEHWHKDVMYTVEKEWGLAKKISFRIISSGFGWSHLGKSVYWVKQIDGGL